MGEHKTEATGQPAPKTDNGAQRGPRSENPTPQASLTKVIEFVKIVRKAAGNADAPAADVMKEMGITVKTTRAWSFTVPAASQFGLIERIGRGEDAKFRITELAKRIVQPVSADEERAAKMAALRTPLVYQKLLEKYAGCEVPSKDGLVNHLCREFGILESTAPNTADCFLESLGEAQVITTANQIVLSDQTPASPPKPAPSMQPPAASAATQGMKPIEVPADFVPHHFTLRRGMVVVIPLPPDLTGNEVKRLSRWLETLPFDDAPTGGPAS